LVPETPLSNLPGTSRKDLDASRIFSLQKSNGLIFSVRDKATTSKLVDLVDLQVAKNGFMGQELGDQ